MTAKLSAMEESFATIEFSPEGRIMTANPRFLQLMGYSLQEIVGQHHSLFVPSSEKKSLAYRQFWDRLSTGEVLQDEFKCLASGSKEIWLQATYTPLVDEQKRVTSVVEFARDITSQKRKAIDLEGQITGINASFGIIEFAMDGTILFANDNFLQCMGYRIEELQGKHHRLFVTADFAKSSSYSDFWQDLNRGQLVSGEFSQLNKNGESIWLQASYNPIFDANNKPYKIVKYASDITDKKMREVDLSGQVTAIGKSQAVIEFTMDGTIITANDNFLTVMGYKLSEIIGQHHSLFVSPETRNSKDYQNFWSRLRSGEYQADEFKRLGKAGNEVWIVASYNPILDSFGKPFKVVKYATDVTQQKLQSADFSGQINAIGKSQAIIEFEMDGTIINANPNFLNCMNYTLEEIKGKHHAMFVDATFKNSTEYREFWQKLKRGEYISGEFKRLAKQGKEVWIQASYNPIFDLNGNPLKVVKYATDVTREKMRNADIAGQMEAISKAQAIIEFTMDGSIITANDNFLTTLGYRLDEIQNKHHSMFIDKEYKSSKEYQDFWRTLRQGQFISDEFKRIGKNGKIVWIQASYNPIFDLNGVPVKVVKYATDVTARKTAINLISESLLALSEGDLSKTIDQELQGEFDLLRHAMNSTLQRLTQMVGEIVERANYVNTSAQEIQSGSYDLSQRTEEQAASLEETAASVEELTTTVTQNAQNARRANELAIAATDKAQYGGEVINGTILAMSEINAASKKIADIIGVIDEIAFQTNLLALNAAVEAARAGEQGRGFAVVAGEVRNLAQRSASAAKEIKSLINDSVVKVSDGTKLVNRSGETLTEIVKAIKSVTDLIADINNASQEQASGIQQVNTTVMQMDTMTQQNAAMVEEASAASKSMTDQAEELIELIGFFRAR
jgi:methyl-accepting chemotaxis protein